LHDKEWWDFEDREKTSAISYALNYKEPYDTNKEIRTRALEYADAVTS